MYFSMSRNEFILDPEQDEGTLLVAKSTGCTNPYFTNRKNNLERLVNENVRDVIPTVETTNKYSISG